MTAPPQALQNLQSGSSARKDRHNRIRPPWTSPMKAMAYRSVSGVRMPGQRRRVAVQDTTARNSEACWSLTTLALRSRTLVGARIDVLQ